MTDHACGSQVDFLKIAFQENVLELVGLIAQHMGTKTLKADAPVMLDLLHGIYSAFDPRSVVDADASILLSRIKCVQRLSSTKFAAYMYCVSFINQHHSMHDKCQSLGSILC